MFDAPSTIRLKTGAGQHSFNSTGNEEIWRVALDQSYVEIPHVCLCSFVLNVMLEHEEIEQLNVKLRRGNCP